MSSTTPKFYFRAMSVEEYMMWRDESHYGDGKSEIIPGTEWIMNEKKGYGLRYLKENWVDTAYKRSLGDLHAIIVGVSTTDPAEFIETPMYVPIRYTNTRSINFERIKIVYDPRASILDRPLDIDLTDPAKLLRN